MAFAIELIILIIIFTLSCTINTRNVDEHLDWVVVNYPPAIVNRLIEQGRVTIPEPVPLSSRIRKKLPILIVFVVFLAAVVYFVNGCRTFLSAFGTCMLIWTVVDWYDAFILDCLWFCHSKKVRVSGTEDLEEGYKDYLFHIKGSAVGMVFGLVVSLAVGVIAALMGMVL